MRIPERLPLRKMELIEDKLFISNSTDEEGELTIYAGKAGEKPLSIFDGNSLVFEIDAANSTMSLLKDNFKIILGEEEDAEIYWDGTELEIDAPQTKLHSVFFGNDAKFQADNRKLYFGATDDASIYWNGSDLVLSAIEASLPASIFGGNIKLPANNRKIYFGSGDNFNISFDGTDMVFDAAVTASGFTRFGNSLGVGMGTGSGAEPTIKTYSNTNLLILPNGTGYTKIGDDTTPSYMSSLNDNLFVSGEMEIAGDTYFLGNSNFYSNFSLADDVDLRLGDSNDVHIKFSTAQTTANSLIFGVDDNSLSCIMTAAANRNKDHDHAAQSTPTLFIHSAKNPDTANDEWVSITHDGSHSVIDAGSGRIQFNRQVDFNGSSYTAGAPTVSGYVTLRVQGTNYKFAVEA